MLPDRVSNPGPLTYESAALPIALRGPANLNVTQAIVVKVSTSKSVNQQNFKNIPRLFPDKWD